MMSLFCPAGFKNINRRSRHKSTLSSCNTICTQTLLIYSVSIKSQDARRRGSLRNQRKNQSHLQLPQNSKTNLLREVLTRRAGSTQIVYSVPWSFTQWSKSKCYSVKLRKYYQPNVLNVQQLVAGVQRLLQGLPVVCSVKSSRLYRESNCSYWDYRGFSGLYRGFSSSCW